MIPIVSIIVFSSFLITFVLSYKFKIPMNDLTKYLGKQYPEVPFIIMGIGYLLYLILFYTVYSNIPHPTPTKFEFYLIFLSVFVFIPFGIILLIITLSAKRSLEGRVFFTLQKANEMLNQVEDKSQIDTKNLKRYIYLSYKNIKKKIGNLELLNKSDGVSASNLEYTFLNYLPYYIEFARKEQLQALKNSLQTMKDSVKENDEIDWSSLTTALLKLNDEIIRYLRDTNFNVTSRKLSRQSRWILKNKDTIVQIIGLIVSIIVAILAYIHQSPKP